ncbi:MAG: BlaI/MecI/CopY family transcriptional regulator [Hydrogenovibrio sp.]
MLLGELEKTVLQYLWEVPNVDAKHIHSELSKKRGGSLNTIQSTLDRLHKKGLLERNKKGHAFFYQAKVDRDTLIGQLIQDVAGDFIHETENSLIAAFSSVSSKLNEAQLDELEEMIKQQKTALRQETI